VDTRHSSRSFPLLSHVHVVTSSSLYCSAFRNATLSHEAQVVNEIGEFIDYTRLQTRAVTRHILRLSCSGPPDASADDCFDTFFFPLSGSSLGVLCPAIDQRCHRLYQHAPCVHKDRDPEREQDPLHIALPPPDPTTMSSSSQLPTAPEQFSGWLGKDKNAIGNLEYGKYDPKPFDDDTVEFAISHCGVCASGLSVYTFDLL
jgi:hypothetical protein